MDFERFKKFLKEKGRHTEVQEVISWIHSEEATNAVEKELLLSKVEGDLEEDFDAIYTAILIKIKNEEKRPTSKEEKLNVTSFNTINQRDKTMYGAIAASLILLIISSYFFIVTENTELRSTTLIGLEQPIIKTAPKGEKRTVHMTDGTKIKLNGGSSIAYYPNTYESHRQIELVGEAFFDVFRDENHPFEVKVKDKMQVTVLGTSFLVNADNSMEQIVAVKSGRVSVKKITNDQSIIITKDELVKISEFQTLNKKVILNGESVFGWVENRLVLDDAPFIEVLNTINKWFGYDIEVELDYSNYDGYSASLSNPTLKEVMESLAHSYKFSYHINEMKKIIEIE